MYNNDERERINSSLEINGHAEIEEYLSPWRQDSSRLIHSTCFRRLQGKTQLFPSSENDFFRNRLTHSIEVAQIAKDIALRINRREFIDKGITDVNEHIDADLVEFAGLAHDLGHPPFGHQGEEALDECMRNFGGFEGNAQTLRLLSKIEKLKFTGFESSCGIDSKSGKDLRVGLNLTFRTLASILKYDKEIPFSSQERQKFAEDLLFNQKEYDSNIRPVKGYYKTEAELVSRIKKAVLQGHTASGFKTIECSIMDIADDIAYSTYDLEDGLKAGFYSPLDLITTDKKILEKIAKNVSEKTKIGLNWLDIKEKLNEIFNNLFDGNIATDTSYRAAIASSYKSSRAICVNGYHRTGTSERLIGEAIRNIQYIPGTIPALSSVTLKEDALIQVEILKRFTYECQIKSPRLKIAEFRGKDIVKRVFETLSTSEGHELLPADYRELFDSCEEPKRIICDFVAGMTDNYLIEFYGRLFSENPESIFKPI
jgi:dGTPase